MTDTVRKTRLRPQQGEFRLCPYCAAAFVPKRPHQAFCKTTHRQAYAADMGVQGRIVVNRRLMKGRTSIVIHFDGPSADAALNLGLGDLIYVAKVSG